MPTYTPMLTANESRSKSRNDLVIFNEIRDIESDILAAVGLGAYESNTADTVMTLPSSSTALVYFNAWNGLNDRTKLVQMNAVVDYFSSLGYSIERRVNELSGNTFIWNVMW